MHDAQQLQDDFRRRFGATAQLFRAPGRVNLIGEHTDYNAGFAMPAAIHFQTIVAIAPRTDRQLRVHSRNFDEECGAPLPAATAVGGATRAAAHWMDYVCGVAWALQARGIPLVGADMMIAGNVPLGAGLSSSAALEVATALALASLAGVVPAGLELALACQQAENDYVGMRCGIMDPFVSVHGCAGHALLLDCRSLEHRLVALRAREGAAGAQLVVCNSMVRHSLAGSEYNQRRAQCEQGVKSLQRVLPSVTSLRDVTVADLDAHAASLDPLVLRRCRHVVTENVRVQAAAARLDAADLEQFGQLMNESHRSLRDDYAVSCSELDALVRIAGAIEGVLGARMTGGGFGGCTVNLVRESAVEGFRERLVAGYERVTGHVADTWVCAPAEGAGAVPLP
jgi:galactokinase